MREMSWEPDIALVYQSCDHRFVTGQNSNLTGNWWGSFAYPNHLGPVTPFIAAIVDDGASITGTVIEPNTLTGGPSLNAVINGVKQGEGVDFTKIYRNAPQEYATPVDYVGYVSDGGNIIIGVWSLVEFDGTFEMHREPAVGTERQQSVEVERI